MNPQAYYYNRLSAPQQRAYYAILAGLQELKISFPVPRLPMDQLSEIYFLLRLDHPEIFYTNTFSCRATADAEHVELMPEYLYPRGKIPEHQRAMDARIRKLARGAEGLDEKGKERYIHDFICSNVNYDKLKKPYSHEITGALSLGTAVCEGIAKAVKVLCDALKLPCIIAVSDANPDKGIRYRHVWNIITLGGKAYHMDATFDNTLTRGSGFLRGDYLNLNDAQLFRDHEPVIYPVPACSDGSHTFYREEKKAFTDIAQVRSRAAQVVKKNKLLVFQWTGSYLTREVLTQLLAAVGEEAQNRGKYASVSLNWPQAVLCVSFKDQPSEQDITVEQVNEDEETSAVLPPADGAEARTEGSGITAEDSEARTEGSGTAAEGSGDPAEKSEDTAVGCAPNE